VLYSDGLIERRGEDLLLGMERLQRVAATVQDWSSPDTAELLATGMPLEHPLRDDLCILTMHYSPIAVTTALPRNHRAHDRAHEAPLRAPGT
jgi:hypothetical protein